MSSSQNFQTVKRGQLEKIHREFEKIEIPMVNLEGFPEKTGACSQASLLLCTHGATILLELCVVSYNFTTLSVSTSSPKYGHFIRFCQEFFHRNIFWVLFASRGCSAPERFQTRNLCDSDRVNL